MTRPLTYFKNKSQTFCMHPFTGMSTREDGLVRACCKSGPVGDIKIESISSIWNNEQMRSLRMKLLNGETPSECQICFDVEKQGVQSLRQRHTDQSIPNARGKLFEYFLESIDETSGTMPFECPTIEIKTNNLCNLKCRMCNPLDSTSWNDWTSVEEFMDAGYPGINKIVNDLGLKRKPYVNFFENSSEFWSDLQNLVPFLKKVEFAGGEPLMDPMHYKVLEELSKNQSIELRYSTNGTYLGIKKIDVFDYWRRFRKVNINVSLDGTKRVHEYVRGNADHDLIIKNIKRIKTLDNLGLLVAAFTLQVYNAWDMVDACEEYTNLGMIFYTHRVTYPTFLNAKVLKTHQKKEVCEKIVWYVNDVWDKKDLDPKHKSFTRSQLLENTSFINARDDSHLYDEMIEFSNRLDSSRNQNLFETIPELHTE